MTELKQMEAKSKELVFECHNCHHMGLVLTDKNQPKFYHCPVCNKQHTLESDGKMHSTSLVMA